MVTRHRRPSNSLGLLQEHFPNLLILQKKGPSSMECVVAGTKDIFLWDGKLTRFCWHPRQNVIWRYEAQTSLKFPLQGYEFSSFKAFTGRLEVVTNFKSGIPPVIILQWSITMQTWHTCDSGMEYPKKLAAATNPLLSTKRNTTMMMLCLHYKLPSKYHQTSWTPTKDTTVGSSML